MLIRFLTVPLINVLVGLGVGLAVRVDVLLRVGVRVNVGDGGMGVAVIVLVGRGCVEVAEGGWVAFGGGGVIVKKGLG